MQVRFRLAPLAAALALALLPPATALAATRSPATAPKSPFEHMAFRDLGPATAGGRVTSVLGIPGNPKVYYVGAAGGGVWKTTDGGLSWKAIFAHEATASIGAMALAPSNPNILWVGTGEANIRNDVLDGAGLYLSTDAGKSFRRVGFKDAGQIARIVVDPHDANHVLVAVLGHAWGANAERGVFETTDGGKTWNKTLFVNDQTGAIDLAMQPGNSRVLFAATWQARRYPWALDEGGPGSGIWRSEDGGATWTRLTDGIPKSPLGRIAISVAPSDPELVYALIETKHGNGLLFASHDLGDHWKEISDNYALDVRPFYFTQLQVAPNDASRIYFLSFFLMQSNDGGKTAHPIDKSVHVDHHALWIDPTNPERMIQGNDGGAYLSVDAGKTWRFLDGMPIEQSYMVAADSKRPYELCTGLQDNSGWCGASNSLADNVVSGNDWYVAVGGDGEYVVPAPSDPDIIYADAEDGSIVRFDRKTKLTRFIMPYLHGPGFVNDLNTSDQQYRFNWTPPIAVDPQHADTVYLGGNVVFKSTDGGTNWTVISPDLTRNDKSKQGPSGGPVNWDISGAETYDTVLSMTLAPTDSQVLWAGTDDGLVQVTRDGGSHWSNVTPGGVPKWSRIYQIGVSPFAAGTAYVAADAHELDDRKPYVFRTSDYGKSWTRISDGLPDQSVLVVREDPQQRGVLVAGTMTGVWVSRDDGGHWSQLEAKSLPTAAVFDLQFVGDHGDDLAIATHGRGVLVLDHFAAVADLTPAVEKQPLQVFAPSTGVEWQRWSRGEGAEPSYTAPNAPNGVVLDFWLPKELKASAAEKAAHHGPVEIQVKDAAGHLVATRWMDKTEAGVNRYVWDMSYDGPTKLDFDQMPASENGGEGGNSGPPVLPGSYSITVTADGHSQTVPATVTYDPNHVAALPAQQAALQAALASRNQLSALNRMLNRVTAWQDTLKDFEAKAKDPDSSLDATQRALLAQAEALGKQIATLRDSVYSAKFQHNVIEDDLHQLTDLHGGIAALYGTLASLQNQAPTAPLLQMGQQQAQQNATTLAGFNNLLAGAVAAYNKAAFAAGVPTLAAGQPIAVAAVQ